MRDARPRLLGGRAQQLEDLVQLVVRVADAGERRHAGDHLDEYAADAPHVQRRRVVGAAEQNVCAFRRYMIRIIIIIVSAGMTV